MNISDIAIRQALKSPLKHRYGAVLVHRGKPISVGYNKESFRCCNQRQLGLC